MSMLVLDMILKLFSVNNFWNFIFYSLQILKFAFDLAYFFSHSMPFEEFSGLVSMEDMNEFDL